jgi:CRISPR-associated protein Csb1
MPGTGELPGREDAMEAIKLTYETLAHAVEGEHAALRVITRLEPAGGVDKVFPPTYPDSRNGPYLFEDRWIGGEKVPCVILNAVQAEANRMEDALLDATAHGGVTLPTIEVDFSKTDFAELGRMSVLSMPHRIADAIIRDSALEVNGRLVKFGDTAPGQKFIKSSPRNATGLLEVCPTSLLFGVWDSTRFGKGITEARFQRAVESEIIGAMAERGWHAFARIDPLGIQKEAATIYRTPDGDWTINESEAARDKDGKLILMKRGKGDAGKPSVINHGNVTSREFVAGGVSIRYGLQTTLLSFAALRKLHFPNASGRADPSRDTAARAYLAALGVLAIALLLKAGYDLRSRCLLRAVERTAELIPSNPTNPVPVDLNSLSADAAKELYGRAASALTASGFTITGDAITLKPTDKLLSLMRKNREKIAAGEISDAE